ncbi:MAG: right-handed parallel beta-helix repeat-containing protein [Pseudomonadota bacterium]
MLDHGIYIDDNSRAIDVIGNTIVRGGYSGIKLHNALTINVRDNLVVDTRRAALDFVYDEEADPVTNKGLSIEGNTFLSAGAEASITIFSLDPLFDVSKLGQLARNAYCSPYGPAVVLQDVDGFDFDLSVLELGDWVSFSGLDTTSTICDVRLPTFIETGPGNERLANGSFDRDVEGWTPSPEPHAQTYWSDDSNGQLNLRWLGSDALDFVFLIADVGPLEIGEAFRVDWRGQSLSGIQAYAAPELWDAETAAPMTEQPHRFLPVPSTTQTAYLRAEKMSSAAWLVFSSYSTELPIALEDVSVVRASGRFRTQAERLETLINETDEPALLTVSFDSVDAEGESYLTGQTVEVAARTALVLFPLDPAP